MTFKKITILFLLISTLASADINWDNYKSIFFKAEKSQLTKDVFIFVVSENCGYCKKMKSRIKSNTGFKKYINNNFHTVLINSSKDFIPMELDNGMTPSFYVLDQKTLKVKGGPFVGYMPLNSLKEKVSRTQ